MRKTTRVVLAAVVLGFYAAPASFAISQQQIPQLVKGTRVLAKGYDQCTAVVQADQVHITVPRNPRDTADDLKINAVMIGKAIIDADPSIKIVRVYYLERLRNVADTIDDKYTFVDATKANILGFASGAVTKEELLGSMGTHVYTSSGSMMEAVSRVAPAGPCQSLRNAMMGELYLRSGRDREELDQILPTIDQFAKRIQIINDMAKTNKPEAVIRSQLNSFETDLKAEIARFRAFKQQHPQQAQAQIEAYARSHGIQLPQKAQPTKIAAPAGMKVLSANDQDYLRLGKKYPQLVVNESYPDELRRRKVLALMLMKMSESNACTPEMLMLFSDIESAARVKDAGTLSARLRTMERQLNTRIVVPE